MTTMTNSRSKKPLSKKPGRTSQASPDKAQGKRFREAAREAGVDPDVDVDELMRRLAGQTRKGRSK